MFCGLAWRRNRNLLGTTCQAQSKRRCSDGVIRAIPIDEPPDAQLERRGRAKTHVALEVIDIRGGSRHVSGLHRKQIARRLAAETPLQQLDETGQLLRMVIPDVVSTIR